MTNSNLNSSLMAFLDFIVKNNQLHQKFLNTMSYMESIGARKIHRSLNDKNTTFNLLQHAAEESRHAFFFKRLAKKIHFANIETYHKDFLLGGFAAKHYMNGLETLVCRQVRSFKPCDLVYNLVTLLVEIRATQIYESYEIILKKNDSRISVSSILKEEKRHLLEVREQLKSKSIPGLEKLYHSLVVSEEILYLKFLNHLITMR